MENKDKPKGYIFETTITNKLFFPDHHTVYDVKNKNILSAMPSITPKLMITLMRCKSLVDLKECNIKVAHKLSFFITVGGFININDVKFEILDFYNARPAKPDEDYDFFYNGDMDVESKYI